MSGAYEYLLDAMPRVLIVVEFKTAQRGREVTDYSVVLVVEIDGRREAVRLYDGAHGENEVHKYTRDGISRQLRSSIAVRLEKV
jgi:hypothetical protein